MSMVFSESDLVLNKDGGVYHLNLLPEDIADTIFLVGDPDRVAVVSQYFDRVELKKQKREFVTHTGTYQGKRFSVISTGIGPDNIDIVVNELDALSNIDLKKRVMKDQHKRLNLLRIGTSGGLQNNIPVDSYVVNNFAIGVDGLMNFYDYQYSEQEARLHKAFTEHYPELCQVTKPYVASGSIELIELFSQDCYQGINITCGGFYGPQGRRLIGKIKLPDYLSQLRDFDFEQHKVTNFEMETSAIYGLGNLLGHNCCSLNAIIAQRSLQKFSADYMKTIAALIQLALKRLTAK